MKLQHAIAAFATLGLASLQLGLIPEAAGDGSPTDSPVPPRPAPASPPATGPSGADLFPKHATTAGLLSWKTLTRTLDPATTVQLRAVALAMSPEPLRKLLATLATVEEVGGFLLAEPGGGYALLARGATDTKDDARPSSPRQGEGGGTTTTVEGRVGAISYSGVPGAIQALRAQLASGGAPLLREALGGVLSRVEPTSPLWLATEVPPSLKRILTSLAHEFAPPGAPKGAAPDRIAFALNEVGGRAEARLIAEHRTAQEALVAQMVLENAAQMALAMMAGMRPAPINDAHSVALDAARALAIKLLRSLNISLDGRFLEAKLTSPVGLGETVQTFTRAVVPMFQSYIAQSKAVEARVELRRIVTLAGEHLRMLPREADGRLGAGRFPVSAPRTPDATACDFPERRFPASAERFAHPTWKAIGFALNGPHYFRYELETRVDGPKLHFRAVATADLDCNGVFSRYEQAGVVDRDGALKLEAMSVENPLE